MNDLHDRLNSGQAQSATDNIIVLSDFHLAGGRNPQSRAFAPVEGFVHDAAFARFLEYLSIRATEQGCRWRLIFLGDLVDFLQTRSTLSTGYHQDTSDSTIRRKLEAIVEGHPEFFEALGRFAARGFQIQIVSGNHDVELSRPAVQEGFKQSVAKACGLPEAAKRIDFIPWICYIPDLLYAEHGHQYHDINSFVTPLRPYRTPGVSDTDQPPGAYLHEYLLNRSGYSQAPVHHHLQFLGSVLGATLRRVGPTHARRRAKYRDEILRLYSVDTGLSYETLVAIDELAAVSGLAMIGRVIRKFLLEAVAHCAHTKQVTTSTPDYMFEAALAIHNLLQAANRSVPFYVFGHTHKSAYQSLARNGGIPHYINTGTWTKARDTTGAPASESICFSFAKIAREPQTGEAHAHLMRWDDAHGVVLPLLSENS